MVELYENSPSNVGDIKTVAQNTRQIINLDDVLLVAQEIQDSSEVAGLHCLKDDIREHLAPPSLPFSKIAAEMANIDQEGFVKKKLNVVGVGRKIAKGDSVLFHYQMFFENKTEPFDSSILRLKPLAIKLIEGNIIDGLVSAISTMQAREVSTFVISWKVAFGCQGCPPRILPKADVFALVQVIKILDEITPELSGELYAEEGSIFDRTIEECELLINYAKELVVSRSFKEAVTRFKLALEKLDYMRLSNYEEERKLNKLKLRIHVNLAGLFNYRNKAELACIHCQEAFRLDPNNAKALFNFGRAKIRLNDFECAKVYLERGQHLNPQDPTFPKELVRLQEKRNILARRQLV